MSGLLRAYRQILFELKKRNVTRTMNSPTGDLDELLITITVGGELAPNSEKGMDVHGPNGQRIQVKSRVLTEGKPGERQLSAIRSWDFTHLAVVLFDNEYSVIRASMIPVDRVRAAASYVAHVAADRVLATDGFLDGGLGEDITEEVTDAYRRLDSEYT